MSLHLLSPCLEQESLVIGKHKYIYAKVQRPEGVGVGFSMDLGVRLRSEVQIISFSLGEGSIGGARGLVRKML